MFLLKLIMVVSGGVLFLLSAAGYLFVRIKLRPREKDLEEVYYEFEDQMPQVKRYESWQRLTFAGVVVSMLLVFLGVIL